MTVNPGKEPLWYLMLNTEDEALLFHLPQLPPGFVWKRVVDTSRSSPDDIAPVGQGFRLEQQDRAEAAARSMVLLHAARGDGHA
jgi:hypothetical protein